MSWYNREGAEGDVVVSSRVRFARNLSDKPFMSRISADDAAEIISRVRGALSDEGLEFTDFGDISPVSAAAFADRHEVSPEFARSTLPHALLRRGGAEENDDGIGIMLCEEDHLRIQSILPGLALEQAYKNVCRIDDKLGQRLPIAFDDQLGYLTGCPTNLGTGMRASVMLFLPAVTARRQIGSLSSSLSKLGLTIRGYYGEGSDADGCFYQISNQVTLGVDEEETLEKLGRVAAQIIKMEREARRAVFSADPDAMTDRVRRSLGLLRSAYLLDSAEFLRLSADVRLGIALGIIDGVDYPTLGTLLVSVMPASLTAAAAAEGVGKLDGRQRDLRRAETVRRALGN